MNLPGDHDEYGNGAGDAGQLGLSDNEDALPWLESEEDYEEEGNDYRIVIFVIAAALALAAILLGVNYFLSDRTAENTLGADGSTIEAPEQPYKTRPENPGGSEVAGTGDVSFIVGQGQGREGQLADNTPSPSIDLEQPAGEAAASGGVGVQIGAFQTRAGAQTGWINLRARHSVLQSVNHRIIEGTVDSGTIYRLQAVASDVAAAESLCRAIRNGGGDCQVKR